MAEDAQRNLSASIQVRTGLVTKVMRAEAAKNGDKLPGEGGRAPLVSDNAPETESFVDVDNRMTEKLPIPKLDIKPNRPKPAPPPPPTRKPLNLRSGLGRSLTDFRSLTDLELGFYKTGEVPRAPSPDSDGQLMADALSPLSTSGTTRLSLAGTPISPQAEAEPAPADDAGPLPSQTTKWESLFVTNPRIPRIKNVPNLLKDAPREDTDPRVDLNKLGAMASLATSDRVESTNTDEGTAELTDATLHSFGAGVMVEGHRYQLLEEVATGAQGRISFLEDKDLGRTSVIKVLLGGAGASETKLDQFISEAKLTAQLEHPGIVPVYDIGRLQDGSIYYTMRRVEGIPLTELIAQARQGNPKALSRLTLDRSLGMVRQLCRALEYAHRKGVIHRDIKADNIMVGPQGDVYLMDWGLAKVSAHQLAVTDSDATQDGLIEDPRRYQTTVGTVKGTPAYMAPEQAMGRVNLVDRRSDIYSVGAILYELLTFHPPFTGRTIREVLGLLVIEAPVPPRRRRPERAIPRRVEEICLRCLEKDPSDRYQRVEELVGELDSFINKEGIRLQGEALFAEGLRTLEGVQDIRDRIDGLHRSRAEALEAGALEGEALRQRLYEIDADIESLGAKIAEEEGKAEISLIGCLGCVPDHEQARHKLRQILRKEEAILSQERDILGMARLKGRGEFVLPDSPPQPTGLLSLNPSPPAASLTLKRVKDQGRRWTLEPLELPGESIPMRLPLPEGSYILEASHPRHATVRYPVFIQRMEHWRGFLQVPEEGDVSEDEIYIAAGAARLGGSAGAPWARVDWLPTYVLGRDPVTFGEYLVFLRQLKKGGEDISSLLPRLGGQGALVIEGEGGELSLNLDGLRGGDDVDLAAPGVELPVVGVTFYQALAYCRWRSRITRSTHRLPTPSEWEKAARGVDGRPFPWGHRFESSACQRDPLATNQGALPGLRPVGTAPLDVSPYGMRDLIGGVREWCIFEAKHDEDAPLRPLMGGSWMEPDASRPLYAQGMGLASEGQADVGFRLVRELKGKRRKG